MRQQLTSALPGRAAWLLLAVGLGACEHRSSATSAGGDVILAETVGTNAIYFHRSTAAVDSLKPLLLTELRQAIDSIDRVVPVRNLQIRVIADPAAVLPPFGVSAISDSTGTYLFLDPTSPDLRKRIDESLVPALAHEYYHVLRSRTAGYGSTLFEAMVSEGLSDQFGRELTGRPPPWLGSAIPLERPTWRRRAALVWCKPHYDHAAWFGGVPIDRPRGMGFAIGYAVVGEYLAAHPAAKPSALLAAAPRVFLPPALRGDPIADCWRGGAAE